MGDARFCRTSEVFDGDGEGQGGGVIWATPQNLRGCCGTSSWQGINCNQTRVEVLGLWAMCLPWRRGDSSEAPCHPTVTGGSTYRPRMQDPCRGCSHRLPSGVKTPIFN